MALVLNAKAETDGLGSAGTAIATAVTAIREAEDAAKTAAEEAAIAAYLALHSYSETQ